MERLVFATSNGLYTAMLAQDGTLEYEGVFLESNDVTNVERIKDDSVIVTLNDEEGLSRIETVDTGTNATELIIDQDDYNNSFDIDKVPGTTDEFPFYILHQASGLHIVDQLRKKLYTLSHEKNDSYNTCRSVALTLIDDQEPAQGFWMAWLDNSMNYKCEIKIYEFNATFMAQMVKLSNKVDEQVN